MKAITCLKNLVGRSLALGIVVFVAGAAVPVSGYVDEYVYCSDDTVRHLKVGIRDVYVFTNVAAAATMTLNTDVIDYQYLVCGGGGSGGWIMGGGGGGGGVLTGAVNQALQLGTVVSVTVGSGAKRFKEGSYTWNCYPGYHGDFSSLQIGGGDGLIALGGGGGATWLNTTECEGWPTYEVACGGGGGRNATRAAGRDGQGCAGGIGHDDSPGGGGGAAEPGGDGESGGSAGKGGEGVASYITGVLEVYGSGGGGGMGNSCTNWAYGGVHAGHGGRGGVAGTDGDDGFGGGGGGGGYTPQSAGGFGGNGTVILSLLIDPNKIDAHEGAAPVGTRHQLDFDVVIDWIGADAAGVDVSIAYAQAGQPFGEYVYKGTVTAAGDFRFSQQGLKSGIYYDYIIKLENGFHIEYITGTAPTVPITGDGGDISFVTGGYVVHVFDEVGEFSFLTPTIGTVRVEYLIVGGGGGGGGSNNGITCGSGGGGGGAMTGAVDVVGGTPMTVVVGDGGVGGTGAVQGTNGEDSSLEGIGVSLVAYGGGGGGCSYTPNLPGLDGGNGGGGAGSLPGGLATMPNGFPGGAYSKEQGSTSNFRGNGGGGAGGPGGSTIGDYGGAGGAGLASAITGETVLYAGGGAGGGTYSGATEGGGGVMGADGTDGLGGGGGGGAKGTSTGGKGGGGIVILRYKPLELKVAAVVSVEEEIWQGARFGISRIALGEDVISTDVSIRYGVAGGPMDGYAAVRSQVPAGEDFEWTLSGLLGGFTYNYEMVFSVPGETFVSSGSFRTIGPSASTDGDMVIFYENGDWNTYVFLTNGTFTPPGMDVELEYLVVAGGGGGGGSNNGSTQGSGGGGGGVVTGRVHAAGGYPITVAVGGGGAGGTGAVQGTNGDDSALVGEGFSFVAYGGGGGGCSYTPNLPGLDGGNGGGGAGQLPGGRATMPNGFPGGAYSKQLGSTSSFHGNGGGGAGGPGGSTIGNYGGAGGAGLASAITGETVLYAGGGAGGGGVGYSGTAEGGGGIMGEAGEDGLGGGGGGGAKGTSTGGKGGSGVVVVRYRQVPKAIVACFAVTNRSLDSVVFDCRISQIGNGSESAVVTIDYRERNDMHGGSQTLNSAATQNSAFSAEITGLSEHTLYDYTITVVSEHWSEYYQGSFMTDCQSTYVDLVERGPGFLRYSIGIEKPIDDETCGDIYLAIGPDAEHLGEYELIASDAEIGFASTNLTMGLDADTDYLLSTCYVPEGSDEPHYYSKTLHTMTAVDSAVPLLDGVDVDIDGSGRLTISAFVPWGGDAASPVRLLLRYGRNPGEYRISRYVSDYGIGTIVGSALLRRGDWYLVISAVNGNGESEPSEEFHLRSNCAPMPTILYVK